MSTTNTPSESLPIFPVDVTELGRGRGQRAVLGAVHKLGPTCWLSLTEDISRHVTRVARGLHFSAIQSACSTLVKRGILEHRVEPGFGDFYRLVPHTHAA